MIAEAHESNGGKGIFYRLGHLSAPGSGDFNIVWDSGSKGQPYDEGVNPHIAIDDNNNVVEVHQVASNEDKLHSLLFVGHCSIAAADDHSSSLIWLCCPNVVPLRYQVTAGLLRLTKSTAQSGRLDHASAGIVLMIVLSVATVNKHDLT